MVLADPDGPNPGPDDAPRSHFLYARVMNAYHTYVYLDGPSSTGPDPIRLDFLWIRWYELGEEKPYSLRAVHFPPVLGGTAFDFLDPSDVLRASHIVPVFKHGLLKEVSQTHSPLAKDEDDWVKYCVGR